MGALFDRIRRAVDAGDYSFGTHADDVLRERSIPAWQAVEGLARGRLIVEWPRVTPNPKVEVDQTLPDGTPVKAVWAWLRLERQAKLVTVHFYDR